MSPADEYSSRLAAREACVRQVDAAQERVSNARLALAVVAVVLAWLSWHGHWFSALWILAPVAAFVAAVIYHSILRRRSFRAARAAAFYRRGLARIEERWAGQGQRGEQFNDAHHVYARDLDIFGEGGLFELLCEARTQMGEAALAGWLLAPAAPEDIRERHACVTDLRDRLDLREHLGTLGEEAKAAIHPQALMSWAMAPGVLGQAWIGWLAIVLPVLLAGSVIVGYVADVWLPCVFILAIEAAVLYVFRQRLFQVLNPAETAFDSDDLKTFAGLLARIQQESFASSPMQALVGMFCRDGRRASSSVERLSAIVALAEQRRNLVVSLLLAVPFLYAIHVALAAERWRRAHGETVQAWLTAAGQFEALSALAQYSFEHPEDPFPDFLEGPASLRAQGIGHPLIPLARCVRTDVSLVKPVRVLLVSGSNMSGKSTLLRAVGLNTVLAMAGAPVRAHTMQLTPLQVGASIRISDSLREGSSRFYAEITRLRQINGLTERGLPLLFLLDEMLQGTNSSDRRIGAEAVLGALQEQGAIGIATTHDLALTELPGLGEGILRNVHFQDYIEDGMMRFDYKLHDGVVTKSNGIELMRAIGLRV